MTAVYASNLSKNVTREQLEQLFSRYGELTNIFMSGDLPQKKGGIVSILQILFGTQCLIMHLLYSQGKIGLLLLLRTEIMP